MTRAGFFQQDALERAIARRPAAYYEHRVPGAYLAYLGSPITRGEDVAGEERLLVRDAIGYYGEARVRVRDADVFGEAAVYAAAEGPAAVGVCAVVHPAVFAEEALAAICLHVHGDALAGLHLRDAAPDASTTPTISWPIVTPGTARGTLPCLMCRSLVHMLASVTRTMASPGSLISGRGLSARRRSPLP